MRLLTKLHRTKMMTDLEISKALALAIGYSSTDVAFHEDMWAIVVHTGARWREFDYKDWSVIGPIAERYDCFPKQLKTGAWCCVDKHDWITSHENTPQKAIALAVIDGAKK